MKIEERRRAHVWLPAALIFVVARALPNLDYPIFRDQATYCVIAQRLLEGQKLYRDVWDNKPPGIFWIYIPIVKAFGPVMWSVGVVDILWLLAISCCIFWLSRRYLGDAGAAIAAAVNAEWHCRAGYEHAAQADAFIILFVMCACLVAWRQGRRQLARTFCAGLLFGAAFWLKYTAIVFLPLLAFVPCVDFGGLDSHSMRLRLAMPWRACLERTLALLTGSLASVVLVLAYCWREGLWTALAENFRSLHSFTGAVLTLPHYWASAISKTVVYLGLSLVALFAGFVVARKRGELGVLMPILIGSTLGFGATIAQLTFISHTFENCYPFFVMIWGYLAVKSFEWLESTDRGFVAARAHLSRAFMWVLVTAGALLLLGAEGGTIGASYQELRDWSRAPVQFYTQYPRPFLMDDLEDQMKVIGLLKEKSESGDGLYVWGHYPLLYYLTGLRAPTRFVVSLPFSSHGWALPEWRTELIRDLRRAPPGYLAVSRRDSFQELFPELENSFFAKYTEVAEFPRFIVYRRKDLTRPSD